jgi:hypothetical protein
MILSPTEEYVFSSLGWVDGSTVWRLDTATGKASTEHVKTAARYLALHDGIGELFSIAHHYDTDKFEVSVHIKNSKIEEVARFTASDSFVGFTGNSNVWESVPAAYVSYFAYKGVSDYWLCLLRGNQPRLQRFDWYDDSYDKGYQGIVGVVEVPDSPTVLVSVQRDSEPLLFDPTKGKVIRKIKLAGHCGNPALQFSRSGQLLWADDYDTLLKIDRKSWSVIKSKQLQSDDNGTSQFIGDYWLNSDESLCVVARPFSSDVVALDTRDLKTRYECSIGRQPLQAVMLSDNRVFGRDWKSGDALAGIMKRKSRFSFFN